MSTTPQTRRWIVQKSTDATVVNRSEAAQRFPWEQPNVGFGQETGHFLASLAWLATTSTDCEGSVSVGPKHAHLRTNLLGNARQGPSTTLLQNLQPSVDLLVVGR